MKEKFLIWVYLLSSAMVGVLIGNVICDVVKIALFPKQQCHVCTCELCKVKRQLETCEVLDSIFMSKIEIEVNKK